MKRPEKAETVTEHSKELPTGNLDSGISGSKQAFVVVGDGVLGAGLLIMIGAWGGNLLDDRFHTTPWLSLSLSLLLGGLGLARLVAKANKLDSRPDSPMRRKSK